MKGYIVRSWEGEFLLDTFSKTSEEAKDKYVDYIDFWDDEALSIVHVELKEVVA